LIELKRYRDRIDAVYKGPAASLLLGNLADLVREGGFGEQFFTQLHQKYGSFARLWLGGAILNLSVSDPEHQNVLYRLAEDRPKETEMFLNYLGHDNLLFQHGPMVKELRQRYFKVVATPEEVRAMHDDAISTLLRESKNWHRGPVDAHAEFGPMIYDVVGRVLFKRAWSTHETGVKIRRAHLYLIKNVNRWMFFPDWLKPRWNADYREYVATVAELRSLCAGMLEERRKELESRPEEFEGDTSALTFLAREKEFFTPHLACSTMIGFLNGSFDTTHATVTWLFYNLAKNPEAQRELHKELDGRIGRKIAPSIEELRELPYLHACVMESMRLFCTVPINQRVNLNQDISLNGLVVPKGVNVNVAMIYTMKSPEYFGPDPLVYRPSRFVGEDVATKHRVENWMAFGAHGRMCVGANLALAETKAIIATLLQRFELSLDARTTGEYKTEAGVTQPTGPVWIHFKERVSESTL